MYRFKHVGRAVRRLRATNGGLIPRRDEEGACAYKLSNPMLPRKAPAELISVVTVPETDTGGRDENSKALERTLLKELGKLIP